MNGPIVLAVLNGKGGVGKSTVAANVARGIQLSGRSTLLVDTDPQGTLSVWSNLREDDSPLPGVSQVTGEQAIRSSIGKVARGYDVAVIDGAAKLNRNTIAAVKAAHYVIVPVQPAGPDLWSSSDLVEWIEERREATDSPLPHARFLISRQIVGTALAREVEGALDEYGLGVFRTRISQRIAYAEAISQGSTVLDTEPGGKAAIEIENLTKEILDWIYG